MDKGYWVEVERVKADAAPIDNVTKFAWGEEDIETVREWVDYTPEEIAAMDEAEERDGIISNASAYFAALTSAFGEVEQ